MPPKRFFGYCEVILGVDRSIEILGSMGFGWLPERLSGWEGLRNAIQQSHLAGQRLSLEQIREFDRLMLGDKS